MSSFSLATRLLLLLITGYSLFTCRKQDDIRSNHTNIVFKPASFDILFRNWTQLLVSLRRHRQMSASTCILKLNSSVSILLLILIANDCSTINPGPPQNPCGECGKAVRSNQRGIECEECYVWYHKRCLAINSVNFRILEQHPSYVWICCNCGLPSFTSSFFLSSLELTNRFAILSDSEEYVNEASQIHTFSPLHSTPKRANRKKTEQHRVSAPTVHHSPIYPAHGFSSADSYMSQNSISSSSRSDHRSEHSTDFPFAKKDDQIRVCVINFGSLISHDKHLQLCQFIETYKPDVILGCETKLEPSIQSSSIFPDEYTMSQPNRKDRAYGGGGVLIAVRGNIIAAERLSPADCEIVWTKIFHDHGTITFGSFYRQPSSSDEIMDQLSISINNLKELNGLDGRHVILGGDFNLPDIEWSDGSIKPNPQYARSISEKILDILDDNNLTQIVHEPTRLENTLDLIFTTHPDLIVNTFVVPGMSEHSAVICDINFKLTPPKVPQRTVYVYKKADMEGLKLDLEQSFETLLASEPSKKTVEENWVDFKTTLVSTSKKHIPQKNINGKRTLPWVNTRIRRLIRQKQRRYNTARRTKSDQNWHKFKQLRKTVHKEIEIAHRNYVNNLFDFDECDDRNGTENSKPRMTKRFWRYIKAKRKDQSGIPVLKVNGKDVTDPTEKANILSDQYDSVFTTENPIMPTLDTSDIPDMPSIVIDTNGVTKLLQSVNPSKASGPDMLPTRVLKETAPVISPFLSFIFQQSVDTGTIPNDWRHANITAIHKKGPKTEAVNYRPISLTSVPCKLLEHIIFHQIMSHLDAHSVLVDYQHGFRKNRSCEIQLINAIEDLARSLNNRNQTDMLILDFSKAFDTVAHNRLLLKLNHYGIRGANLAWMQSWLTSRTQQVLLEGKHSRKIVVRSGVPQGTVLGPLCFLLYINDIGNGICSTLRLFADDTLLYGLVHNNQDAIKLQEDLDNLTAWAQTWQMNFHPSKCYVLRIHRSKEPTIHNYTISGHILQSLDQHPYLGVTITKTLNWKAHVSKIKNKANKTLGFIKRNLHSCPEEIKSRAYTTLVRPMLEYSSAAWDPYRKYQVNCLEMVQRRAARFVTRTQGTDEGCVTRALNHLQWPTLESRRKVARLSLLHKTLHGKASVAMPSYVTHKPDLRTRGSHPMKFLTIQSNCDEYKNSFWPRTIREWNKLPPAVLDINNTELFKTKLTM